MWSARFSRQSCAGGVDGRILKAAVANAMENLVGRKTRKREARSDEVRWPGASEKGCCLLVRVKSQLHRVQDAELAGHTSGSTSIDGLRDILRGDPIE
jgi:hypothetical protein